MVRILSTGEIVQDDDPRAQQSRSLPQTRSQTRISAEQQQRGHQQRQTVSIFQSLNQKLHGMGIPPFRIGEIVIEPIVTVGFLFALLMFGIHGLIFGAVLFAVSQWSSNGAPDIVTRLFGGGERGSDSQDRQVSTGRSPNNRGAQGTGTGYILGRS